MIPGNGNERCVLPRAADPSLPDATAAPLDRPEDESGARSGSRSRDRTSRSRTP